MNYKVRKNFTKDLDKLMEEILLERGVTDIKNFATPTKEKCLYDYNLLDNIHDGVNLLINHLKKNSHIVLIPDADADGITSSAILWLYIKTIFPDADLNFRMHEGKQHGLEDMIDWLINEEQFDLVICPDSASNDINFMKRLNDIKTDVLVLDHHTCDYEGYNILPQNTVLINNQQSLKYPNKSLCGAGVVYKFCQALDNSFNINIADNFLDLVALGEISDVMSRTNIETNYLMMEGLKHINNKGFKTFIEEQSFSLKEKAASPYIGLTAIDIAFYVTPLINSIVRVGNKQENESLFYAFIEPDRPMQSTKRGAKPGDIELAAKQAARVGGNCKSKQNRIKDKAMGIIDFKIQKDNLNDNKILIIELDQSDDIPQAMSGLVAQNVLSKYGKPCLIVRRAQDGFLRGSARGNSNFLAIPNFRQWLESSGFFEYNSGHDSAFGSSINSLSLQPFLDYANKILPDNAFENCYLVDYELNANDKDLISIIHELASYPEFFGNGIDEPTAVIKNIPLQNILVMGQNKDSIKISYNGIDYIKFKDENFINNIMSNRIKTIDIYGKFNLNYFAGRVSVQCFIDDYQFSKEDNKFDF